MSQSTIFDSLSYYVSLKLFANKSDNLHVISLRQLLRKPTHKTNVRMPPKNRPLEGYAADTSGEQFRNGHIQSTGCLTLTRGNLSKKTD